MHLLKIDLYLKSSLTLALDSAHSYTHLLIVVIANGQCWAINCCLEPGMHPINIYWDLVVICLRTCTSRDLCDLKTTARRLRSSIGSWLALRGSAFPWKRSGTRTDIPETYFPRLLKLQHNLSPCNVLCLLELNNVWVDLLFLQIFGFREVCIRILRYWEIYNHL